jgi:hypothetical protein
VKTTVVRKRRCAVTVRQPPARGGFALLAALLCLIMLSLAVSSLVGLLVDELHVALLAEKKLQSRSLASAGLDRAVIQLEWDPSYRGEVWELTVDEEVDLQANVEITIEPLAHSARRCRIRAIATYPSNSARSVRTELAILAPIPTGGPDDD